ncbi:hypothetical protein [Nocardia sp. IFM 10818]
MKITDADGYSLEMKDKGDWVQAKCTIGSDYISADLNLADAEIIAEFLNEWIARQKS